MWIFIFIYIYWQCIVNKLVNRIVNYWHLFLWQSRQYYTFDLGRNLSSKQSRWNYFYWQWIITFNHLTIFSFLAKYYFKLSDSTLKRLLECTVVSELPIMELVMGNHENHLHTSSGIEHTQTTFSLSQHIPQASHLVRFHTDLCLIKVSFCWYLSLESGTPIYSTGISCKNTRSQIYMCISTCIIMLSSNMDILAMFFFASLCSTQPAGKDWQSHLLLKYLSYSIHVMNLTSSSLYYRERIGIKWI